MDPDKIERWCEIEEVLVNHVCVLSRVDMRTLEEVLIRWLSTVKAVGKVEIVAREFGKMADSDFVLVQTSADVTAVGLPASIGDPGEAGPCGVHIVTEKGSDGTPEELPDTGGRDFRDRVLLFLRGEGRERTDLENLISPHPPWKAEGSELASAINSLVNKAAGPRQKLRIFSGRTPTPEGENNYETWVEHVSDLLGDGQCSEEEKRQRLVESLRGVAAEVVRGVKANQPSASLTEYPKALEEAFGLTGSTVELLAGFWNMHQDA
ncbi:paraneoplastic antigen Ma1-like [Mobula hypostoma]|uniref:paraneoplastic antigen Ma1-like n=1 Tax=Mobula hypostoma TaxID=723540 RepID=UPI002FC2D713